MLTSVGQGDQPDIHIQGGLWGFDYGQDGPKKWTGLTVSFAYQGVALGTSILTFASGLTIADFSGYTQAVWLKGQPASANTDRVFSFALDQSGLMANQIRVLGKATNETAISGFTAQVVPPAGGGFNLRSTRGLLRDIKLINTRGIAFLLGGDDLQLIDSSSRDVTPDSGGGVRFFAGIGIRGRGLHIESSDDCFQFNPGDREHETIDRASIVDSVGLTNQGALVAFINGNGRAFIPDQQGQPSNDSLTRLQNTYVRNIRGVTGGSALHGGVALKFYCANSSFAMFNVWAEDVSVTQSDVTPPDTLRAGVMIVTGRQFGGVVGCGVRNLVVENRSGPLVAIAPADDLTAGYPFGKAVDFTVEQARAPGAGSWPGPPLIAAPYADRLVLRDIGGDLSGNISGGVGVNPGRALEIGTDITYAFSGFTTTTAAGTVRELVVDGCATANAAVASNDGIWRFGNVGKADVRRLSTMIALNATPGGIALTQPVAGPGPTFCRCTQVDFTNIATPIVSWQTKVGNEITQSIGFDDRSETVPPLAIGVTTIAPARFAPTIALSLASGVSSASITAMTPPGVLAPRCTLLVPSGVTIANTGSSAGAFQMASSLAGSATASLTVQWVAATNRWREVARTA